MPVVIDATVGGAAANSYVTVAAATTYLEARLNSSAWTSSTSQEAALVEAFRELNLRRYEGRKASDTQTGQWPRDWAIDPDSPEHWYFENTVIPQRIKDAQCELALEFLKAGTSDLAALDSQAGVIEKTIDVITTRWDVSQRPTQGLARFPRVQALLAPLLDSAAMGTRVVRG